jgi:hypothetical protein
MLEIVNVSQPLLGAKSNLNLAEFCFVDGERVLGVLVGEYLAFVDEVIPLFIFSNANDPCRRPCQVGQLVVFSVVVARVMINPP